MQVLLNARTRHGGAAGSRTTWQLVSTSVSSGPDRASMPVAWWRNRRDPHAFLASPATPLHLVAAAVCTGSVHGSNQRHQAGCARSPAQPPDPRRAAPWGCKFQHPLPLHGSIAAPAEADPPLGPLSARSSRRVAGCFHAQSRPEQACIDRPAPSAVDGLVQAIPTRPAQPWRRQAWCTRWMGWACPLRAGGGRWGWWASRAVASRRWAA